MNNSKEATATSMEKAQLNLVLNDPYNFVKQILKASFSNGIGMAYVMEFFDIRKLYIAGKYLDMTNDWRKVFHFD